MSFECTRFDLMTDMTEEESNKKVNNHVTRDEISEIEIDLNAGEPLSKKQKRLLKKGKLSKPEEITETNAPEPRKGFGVWIGNLSYETNKDDLSRFITIKTKDSDIISVKESDLLRINIPTKNNKIKGFAYIDVPSAQHVEAIVKLSESNLNGRNLLIKDSNSFAGRPAKDSESLSKNPPSRILFVGNLSFDTTDDLLEEHFRHCGEIVKIRMATFQDSGKCKGFAFIDFKDEKGPTIALKSKLAKTLINRRLRLEYGEDRSARTPKRFMKSEDETKERVESEPNAEKLAKVSEEPAHPRREKIKYQKRRSDEFDATNKRLKSSVALATAQRASAAIVPSTGKKTKFE